MTPHPHLIPVKPETHTDPLCPACGSSSVKSVGTVFPGIHVLGNYHCEICQLDFLRDLPVGFALQSPTTIDLKSGKPIGEDKAEGWVQVPLLEGYASQSDAPIKIERIVNRPAKDIILLNTLDFLYGHVLLKLFNAQYYLDHHPETPLVIIMPKSYAWLAPKEAAEIWLVDIRLGAAQGWYPSIDKQVQEWLKDFDHVDMARAYAHPRLSKVDIGRFSVIKPFDPARFDELPPHVTFIARTDRLWFHNDLYEFLHRTVKWMGLGKSLGRIFIHAQDRLMKRAMRHILREEPRATFTVTGLAPKGGYGNLANDLRTEQMNPEVERAWCASYAKSQVVVGVHGSNMLLPTAFAVACVEILPDDRIGNMVQDIFVRYDDRMQLFNYRFVDERAKPAQVAAHVLGIFRQHGKFHQAMCVDTV